MNAFRQAIVATTVLVCAAGLAACSSSGGAGTSPSNPAGTTDTVRGSGAATSPTAAPGSSSGHTADAATTTAVGKAYAAFFNASANVAVAERNLQNGDKLRTALVAQVKTAQQQHLGVRVTKVVLLSPDSAAVTFDLLSSGKMLLPNTPGNAVREGGAWKVAARTFCQLVQLTGHPPAACSDPSLTSLPS